MASDRGTERSKTKAFVAQKRIGLTVLLLFVIQLLRSMVYWTLVAVEVALMLRQHSENNSGESERPTPNGNAHDSCDDVSKPKRQDNKIKNFNDMFVRKFILMLLGKKPQDHYRQCTQTLNAVRIALGYMKIAKKQTIDIIAFLTKVIRKTIGSREGTELHCDGNERMLDPQVLIKIEACLAKCIGWIDIWLGEGLPTTFPMVVEGPDGTTQHVTGLDSGAEENLISERKALDLGLRLVPYDGHDLDAIGACVRPLGWVTFKYCVSNKSDWYVAKFAVLDNNHCRSFNILLGREEIEKRSFYRRNRAVLFVQTRSG
ncbi:MAG: hypothetical protein Q9209_000254 [Squamulea sp. 1 TL-2023]